MNHPNFCSSLEQYKLHIENQYKQLSLPSQVQLPTELAVETSFHLAQEISNVCLKGSVSFKQFMQMTLYQPALGYYSAGSQKFGKTGDFVTAPEISPLFAQTFARQFAEIFSTLGCSNESNFIEFGAGSGTFAVNCLLELERLEQLPNQYYILEVSAQLKQRQQELLQDKAAHLKNRVVWLDKLPSNFCGIIFSNEVIDAFPVELIRKNNKALEQAYVEVNDKGFDMVWLPLDQSAPVNESYIKKWPEGYQTEIGVMGKSWLSSLTSCMEKGVIFSVDYGYSERELYAEYRTKGTLQTYYRQHKHANPLLLIGLQDITSSVNFTELAKVAAQERCQLLGFNSQAMFLMGAGINQLVAADRASATISGSHQEHLDQGLFRQGQELRQLLMPDEMGETCKVLAIGKDYHQPLSGFKLQNDLHKL